MTFEGSGEVRTQRVNPTSSARAINFVAFVYIYASRCDIHGVESPSVFANTVGFMPVGLAIGVVPTFHVMARRFALHHGWGTHKAVFAVAVKTAHRVGTDRKGSARLSVAFVYVDANRALGNKAFLTEALRVYTFCVVRAVKVRFAEYVYVDLELDGLVGVGRRDKGRTCSHATFGEGLPW